MWSMAIRSILITSILSTIRSKIKQKIDYTIYKSMAKSSADEAWAAVLKKRAKSIERVKNLPVAKWPSQEETSAPSGSSNKPKSSSKVIPPKKKQKVKPALQPKEVKAAPKPKEVNPKGLKTAQTQGRRNLRAQPVKGPRTSESPGFRMNPAPTADERAVIRNRGASIKAHIRAERSTPLASSQSKTGRLREKATKVREKATKVRESRSLAKNARRAAQAERGFLGRTATRIGKGYKVAKIALAIGGAADWVKTAGTFMEGRKAHSELVKQAGVLRDSGYKATIKKPTLRRMIRGEVGLTIEKTGKPRKRTIGAAPPKLLRR
jgi:hypothetical protein